MNEDSVRVLLIEDNPGDVRMIQEALADVGASSIQLLTANSLTTGFAILEKDGIDLILLDLTLPDSQGLATVAKTKSQTAEIPIVVLTGLNDEETALRAVREGAQDYLVKGQTDGSLLVRAIRYAIERQRLQYALKILALVDDLTGLYNRRGFMMLAEHQILLAQRKKMGLHLVFADLDGMKAINDNYGHLMGDRALVGAAHILRDTFRGSDIIARMGGDEFAVLAIDSGTDGPDAIEGRLEGRIRGFNASGQSPFRLSISIGISHYDPRSPVPLDDLLSEADTQMYARKRARKVAP